jgi:hypothetical protein
VSKRATKGAASADGSKAAGSALDIVAAMDHPRLFHADNPYYRDAGYGYGPYEAYDANCVLDENNSAGTSF